ncbi:hypothetical protein K2X85_07320 [bacterium]|nr:hypothetical protein [bacterium]
MVGDVMQWLDYSRCGEVALVLFCMVFAGVALRAYFMTDREADAYRSIPLEEGIRRGEHVDG